MSITRARFATVDELPALNQRIKDSGGLPIDLYRNPVWVAESDGELVGMLSSRLIWQWEPLLMFPEVKSKAVRRRACLSLYRAAEAWITDSSRNITGVYEVFVMTRKVAVRGWAKKLGWMHQFKRAPIFIKIFKGEK